MYDITLYFKIVKKFCDTSLFKKYVFVAILLVPENTNLNIICNMQEHMSLKTCF